MTWEWPGTDLGATWHWPEPDQRLTWDWPGLTCDWPMRERWRFSALDKLVPDGRTDRQTDRVTPWAPWRSQKHNIMYHFQSFLSKGSMRAIPTIAIPEDYRFMSSVNFLIPHQRAAVQSFTEPYAELGLDLSYSSRLYDWNTPGSTK